MSSSTLNSRLYFTAFMVALLAGLIVSIALTEIMLRRHVLPLDSLVGYKKLFHNGVAPTVAFGDSHVASGLVSSADIDNLGQPSDNLQTTIAKAELRVKRGGVRMVIFQADPQMFSAYREKAKQQDRLAYLMQDKESMMVMLLPQYRQYLMQYWRAAVSDPIGVFRSPQQRLAEPKSSSNAESLDEMKKQAVIRVQLHAPLANFRLLSASGHYRDAIESFVRQGLQVCLVGFPVTSLYRESATNVSSFNAARSFFAKTAHDISVPYLNYYDAMPDSNFGDSDHLSTDAAPHFTRRVLQDCFSGWSQNQ